MRTHTAAAVLIAGLASAAHAQSGSLSIAGLPGVVEAVGTSTWTIDILASADFGTHVAGGGVSIAASGSTEAVIDIQGSAAPWGAGFANDLGADGSGGHNGIIFGQLIFPPLFPPAPESALGNTVVASFVITIANDLLSQITFTAGLAQGQSTSFQVYDEGSGGFTDLDAANTAFGSATIAIPAPSTLALLGLGGAVAGRRRR